MTWKDRCRGIVEDYSTQVLDDGFFHADPHAGNIILKDGIVYFIDLGMVGRMSSHDRGIVKDMIFAVAEGDVPKAQGFAHALRRDAWRLG